MSELDITLQCLETQDGLQCRFILMYPKMGCQTASEVKVGFIKEAPKTSSYRIQCISQKTVSFKYILMLQLVQENLQSLELSNCSNFVHYLRSIAPLKGSGVVSIVISFLDDSIEYVLFEGKTLEERLIINQNMLPRSS